MIHNISAYDDPPRGSVQATVVVKECPVTIGDYCPLFLVNEIIGLRRTKNAVCFVFRNQIVILPRRTLMDKWWIADNILPYVMDPKDAEKTIVGCQGYQYMPHAYYQGRINQQRAYPSRTNYASPEYRGEWTWRRPDTVYFLRDEGLFLGILPTPEIHDDPNGIEVPPPF